VEEAVLLLARSCGAGLPGAGVLWPVVAVAGLIAGDFREYAGLDVSWQNTLD